MKELWDIDIEKDYKIKFNIPDYYGKIHSPYIMGCFNIFVGDVIKFYLDLVSYNACLFLDISKFKFAPGYPLSNHIFKWLGSKDDYSDIVLKNRGKCRPDYNNLKDIMIFVIGYRNYYIKRYGFK